MNKKGEGILTRTHTHTNFNKRRGSEFPFLPVRGDFRKRRQG